MSDLSERFAAAVRALVSDGPIKQRLAWAYSEHLADLEPAEVPVGLRSSFTDLQCAMTRLDPVGDEGRVKANIRKLSTREAGDHANAIVRLYLELMLAAHGERAEPLKVVGNGTKPPRYLTNRS
jgi:hypothetical protein